MDKSVQALPFDDPFVDIRMSSSVRYKLETKHKINPDVVAGCFQNPHRKYLTDIREQHRTVPATQWFIVEYEPEKKLKICFVYYPDKKLTAIKTAYPPCEKELEIYLRAA